MPRLLPDIHYGQVGNFGSGHLIDENDDDEELSQTPTDVVELLGFDPAEAEAEDAVKLPHDAVEYEHPAKGPHHCGECAHYGGPDDCELVVPPIAPEDWCKKFDAVSF